MTCANCKDDAFYVYQVTAGKQILYCHKHLPSFLEKARKAGLLQTTDALKAVLEEGLKNIAVQVTRPAVAEEPVVEEVLTPKPKKKATKKKAE